MEKTIAVQEGNVTPGRVNKSMRFGVRPSPKRNYRAGNKKKFLNPTMAELHAAVNGTETRTAYRSTTKKREEKVDTPVFKRIARLTTTWFQILFFATNKTSEITGEGEDMKNLKKVKESKLQHWPTLADNMVGVVYKPNSAIDDVQTKFFVTCFSGWLNAFADVPKLLQIMEDVAEEIAYGWNLLNSEAQMSGDRVKNEISVLIDVREKRNSNHTTELILVGSSYDFNNFAQEQRKKIRMTKDEAKFQLLLQDGEKKDGKIYKNQMSFTLPEWKEIANSPEFDNFYNQIWDYCPLPQTYARRIETYIQENEDPELDPCEDISVSG